MKNNGFNPVEWLSREYNLSVSEAEKVWEKLPYGVEKGEDMLNAANKAMVKHVTKDSRSAYIPELSCFPDIDISKSLFQVGRDLYLRDIQSQTMVFPYEKEGFYIHDFLVWYIEKDSRREKLIYSNVKSLFRYFFDISMEEWGGLIERDFPYFYFRERNKEGYQKNIYSSDNLRAGGKEEEVLFFKKSFYSDEVLPKILNNIEKEIKPYEGMVFRVTRHDDTPSISYHYDIIGSEAASDIYLDNFLHDLEKFQQPEGILKKIKMLLVKRVEGIYKDLKNNKKVAL